MNTDPDFDFPDPPGYFDDRHRLLWENVHRTIEAKHASTTIEAYCVELLRWRDSEQWLAENGTTISMRDDKGIVKNVIPAPQLKIARDASIRVEKLAATLHLRTHVA